MDTMKTNEQLSRDVVSLTSKDRMIRTIKKPKMIVDSVYDKMQLINVIECVPFGYKQ